MWRSLATAILLDLKEKKKKSYVYTNKENILRVTFNKKRQFTKIMLSVKEDN
jgi:hypothetical protein